MRMINTFFSLAPAPLFLMGFIYSMFSQDHSHMNHFEWEMPAMWLIMAAAHVTPWLMWYQQKQYQKIKVLPEKQQ
jgi:hypothetical protein